MQDSSLDPGPQADSRDDLAVNVDTLSIDGVRPKVGDTVSLKVGGVVRKLVDNTAFVEPETINGEPIPAEPPNASEDEELVAAAQELDLSAAY